MHWSALHRVGATTASCVGVDVDVIVGVSVDVSVGHRVASVQRISSISEFRMRLNIGANTEGSPKWRKDSFCCRRFQTRKNNSKVISLFTSKFDKRNGWIELIKLLPRDWIFFRHCQAGRLLTVASNSHRSQNKTAKNVSALIFTNLKFVVWHRGSIPASHSVVPGSNLNVT